MLRSFKNKKNLNDTFRTQLLDDSNHPKKFSSEYLTIPGWIPFKLLSLPIFLFFFFCIIVLESHNFVFVSIIFQRIEIYWSLNVDLPRTKIKITLPKIAFCNPFKKKKKTEIARGTIKKGSLRTTGMSTY